MANFLITGDRGLRISSIDYFATDKRSNGGKKVDVVYFFLSDRETPQVVEIKSELSCGEVAEVLSYAANSPKSHVSFFDAIEKVKRRKNNENNDRSVSESLKSL